MSLEVGVNVRSCSECRELNKAMEIYEQFKWGDQVNYTIGFDRETNEILISEDQLMRIIQMVNPLQQPRKIRLVDNWKALMK